MEAEGILTYRKSPRNGSVWHFSSKLDVPSKVVQKKRVARILVFKIRPSQEILKIRDGTPMEMPSQEILKIRDDTPMESEGILTYRKSPRNGSMPSQEILKIRDGTPMESEGILTYRKSPRNGSVWPSQEIQKIRDGSPMEAEGILTYRKSPRNGSVWHFSSKLDVPSKVVQKKRVARILVFKIRPSQKIVKIRDGTLWRPSQEIQKIRDGTPMEAEGILTYRKSPRNGSVWHFSSKLDVPSKVVQKKRVARILVFKIRPSQEILKIRDGTPMEMPSQEILKIRDDTPMESEGILTYRKSPRNGSVWPSQEILKIRDGTPMESEGILTYRKSPRNGSKRVARILVFKIRPSQEIQKIRDGSPMEAEGILTYRKSPRNGSVWHFSSKLDVPSKVVQKKRVARILVFKIRPSQKIVKIRDGTLWRVARILVFKIRPSQEIQKIRDGTPMEAEGILTYRKSPRNGSVWHFSSKLDVPSKVVQKKRVARILVFKIRPSQEILKIRDGTPMESEGILTYRKSPRNGSVWHFSSKLDIPSNVVQNKRVARILVFKIRPSQEILKIRDGTPMEKKRVARILVSKIRPSQEILKIRDDTPMESEGILTYRKSPRNGSKKRVARILVFKIRPSQEIQKIRDGTPMEAEGILTYRKSPRNGSVWHFSSKLDVPSKVVQKKRVARILVFKIRPSQEIVKIRDVQMKRVARILVFKIRPSQEIQKIRDGTPMEAEGSLTYRKSPRNGSVWHFSSKLDVPSKVVQKKRVARILVFKIRPSQEILKIRDGTPMELEGILTYRKSPRNGSVWHLSSKLDIPSNVVQNKRVARILFFKIRPSQEILKIRDGTPMEAEGILTYRKSP
ncbi:hypothetical protein OROGR_027298 [Orobanche gracilis]